MKASVKAAILLISVFGFGFTISFVVEKNLHKINSIELFAIDGKVDNAVFQQIKPSLQKKLAGFVGKEIWKVSLEQIMEVAESDKRVASVQVARTFPNSIAVKLLPHRPVLNMMANSGADLLPVARDGSVLPKVRMNVALDLPVLRGIIFHKESNLRERAVNLVSRLPINSVFSANKISEIRYHKKQGFELSLVDSGSIVKLGNDGFEKKIEQVERVLKYLTSKQLDGRVIDARFSKKVVVRLRNAP